MIGLHSIKPPIAVILQTGTEVTLYVRSNALGKYLTT